MLKFQFSNPNKELHHRRRSLPETFSNIYLAAKGKCIIGRGMQKGVGRCSNRDLKVKRPEDSKFHSLTSDCEDGK